MFCILQYRSLSISEQKLLGTMGIQEKDLVKCFVERPKLVSSFLSVITGKNKKIIVTGLSLVPFISFTCLFVTLKVGCNIFIF